MHIFILFNYLAFWSFKHTVKASPINYPHGCLFSLISDNNNNNNNNNNNKDLLPSIQQSQVLHLHYLHYNQL